MKNVKEYQINPVPKPRQTRSDKWKERQCVMNYRAFADECRFSGMHVPEYGARMIFIVAMPKSWSEKKKKAMDGKPHKQTPDVDNMAKALFDSLYKNDSHIYDIRISKFWGRIGKIIIDSRGDSHAEL